MARCWRIAAVGLVVLLAIVGYRLFRARPTAVSEGVTRVSFHFESVNYIAVNVDPRVIAIDLVWKDRAGQPLATLGRALEHISLSNKKPVFATNAGIFSKDRTPLGLHVEDGMELVPINVNEGAGNFFLKPNGVFWLEGDNARIAETTRYKPTAPPRLAVQSGPLLISAGNLNPQFRARSDNLRIRSGVGIDDKGHVIFLLSQNEVNFDAFSRCFRDQLRCRDALYLDGTISHFWLAGEHIRPPPDSFAAMIVVSEPPVKTLTTPSGK